MEWSWIYKIMPLVLHWKIYFLLMKNECSKERSCENQDIWKVEVFQINTIAVSIEYI